MTDERSASRLELMAINVPAPEAAFKVGEPTVEIGAHYPRDVHLDGFTNQIDRGRLEQHKVSLSTDDKEWPAPARENLAGNRGDGSRGPRRGGRGVATNKGDHRGHRSTPGRAI